MSTKILTDSRANGNTEHRLQKKYLKLQRRIDLQTLNSIVRFLKRYGSHDDLVEASRAIWNITEEAREKIAREELFQEVGQ